MRSATSFGFQQIWLSKDCCDPYNEKCIRASQGAIFKVDLHKADLAEVLPSLKDEGFKIIGTSLQSSIDIGDLPRHEKMAFVFGNEGQGVREAVLAACDVNVIIPIHQCESLNVGVAASIIMYLYRG